MDFLLGRLILPGVSSSRFQERSAMGRSISLESSRQTGASQAATVASTKPTVAILVLVVMVSGTLDLQQQDKPHQQCDRLSDCDEENRSEIVLNLLYSRQELHPGQDLWHRGGQREPVWKVMITTRPTFDLFPSLVQRAFAALVGRWLGDGSDGGGSLVCSCPTC